MKLMKYQGSWYNDKFHGKGRIVLKFDYKYDGFWLNGEKSGNGIW